MLKPNAVKWFTVYSIFMAFLYLILMGFGIALPFIADQLPPEALQELQQEQMSLKGLGIIYGSMGFILMIPFLAAPFLPQKPWVWIYDLVLICLGMTSCCFLPICIPLLIFWI